LGKDKTEYGHNLEKQFGNTMAKTVITVFSIMALPNFWMIPNITPK